LAGQKLVASFSRWPEDRGAMRQNAVSRCVAVLACAAFLWTVALAVSPVLHQRVHASANQGEHSCAATFVAAGSYYHASAPLTIAIATPARKFVTANTLNPCWVASPFLSATIFEHAPPSQS
jgi:hypothetical protein